MAVGVAERVGRPGVRARVSGVYRGWWVALAVSAIAYAESPFVNPVLGVLMNPLQDEFGWSRGLIAGGLSIGTLVGALITPVVGPLLDRHGGRVFMAGSCLVMATVLFLMAGMQNAWQYYLLYGLGRALVIGVVGVCCTVTIANWFIRNRGRATAIQLVGSRGGMALTPILTLLAVQGFGWRAACVALGCLTLTFGFLPALLVIRRRPEDAGLRPDGLAPGERLELVNRRGRRVSDARWPVRTVVRLPAFWLLVGGTSSIFAVSGAVNLSMIPHFEDRGLGAGVAVSVVTVWALMGVAGGMLGSEAVQRFGIRWPLVVSMFVTGGGLAWLIFVDSLWMAYAFAVVHGLAFGAQMPLSQVVYAEYFGRWTLGAIAGITAPAQWILGAGGPFIASSCYDLLGSYTVIFSAYVATSAVGGLLCFLARQPAPADHGITVAEEAPAAPA
jgi:sugar phosphate permease